VNISDSTGQSIVSTSGKLQVQDLIAETTLSSINSKIISSRGHSTLWATASTGVNGVSASANLSTISPKVLTFLKNGV
jgi:hypothetical protein